MTWSYDADAGKPIVTLTWEKANGPQVSKPKSRGLGSKLIVPQPGIQSVDLRYRPQGVRCTMVLPVDGQFETYLRPSGFVAEGNT